MNDQADRLRPHPEDRFRSSQHTFDLQEAAELLRKEPPSGRSGHRQKTLYHHGSITVALFLFDANAKMPQHVADGVVMVQVLKGRLRMSAEGQEHQLSPGQVLVLAPGVTHDVQADEPAEMLLTVSLQSGQGNP